MQAFNLRRDCAGQAGHDARGDVMEAGFVTQKFVDKNGVR
jgi:hypothetical protein